MRALLATAMLLVTAQGLTACSTLMFWRDEVPAEDGEGETREMRQMAINSVKPSTMGELELKLAKLWSRVDELEEEQFRQKEKVRVLQKGLTLGLIPEELKPGYKPELKFEKPSKDSKKNQDELELASPDEKTMAVSLEDPKLKEESSPAELSSEKAESYQKALAQAHDHYRAGRYGRAIVDYTEIGKSYGEDIQGGMHRYWIAKCWYALKEYNTTRQNLADFLKEHAASPWAPRAKFDLARTEWKLGLRETALSHFRQIIQEHPYEDAAEMAKMELQNLDKTL